MCFVYSYVVKIKSMHSGRYWQPAEENKGSKDMSRMASNLGTTNNKFFAYKAKIVSTSVRVISTRLCRWLEIGIASKVATGERKRFENSNDWRESESSSSGLGASPAVSFELKFPFELNSYSDVSGSENEFNSTGNFNSKETVGDARRPELSAIFYILKCKVGLSELLSFFCTFENSTKYGRRSFDLDSFLEQLYECEPLWLLWLHPNSHPLWHGQIFCANKCFHWANLLGIEQPDKFVLTKQDICQNSQRQSFSQSHGLGLFSQRKQSWPAMNYHWMQIF